MSSKNKDMLPISRETVEVEGVYKNEEGRELYLRRGEEFPADLVLGNTEWEMTELAIDDHSPSQPIKHIIPKRDKESGD
ncbi:hypothetical protein [Paenibacillus crassostreae]|uniref:Uncharacterized protein n=1 Tax=Paenibacillus crassostreae TaxID=1763538 RepID=A0A167B426_9BACL|nr:hypothetical protein [Paenibacillus crassostreae]AOZ93187.1 hypothetical protein LPB68_13850 [Paenibacillus crassostreae]OAB71722.1 hypothetical protein PNBC_17040 [Paenibacillus crassostreae]